ncbi:hypothetical protein ALC56_14381 [Trachymyrmex septentrionalis]|uniref:Uncharacterized protein n=1 Tax=Trachymyrmex septentrionalis TaxID=34720 RepID=A0A195ETC2_9HYME|nr:hypothetical protein ALC56_14381 [Trachymyrmex septentrionalis]
MRAFTSEINGARNGVIVACVGFVTGTREIKARAHNEVPVRVEGSRRTTVEPNVSTPRHVHAVVLPNAVPFSYYFPVIFIIFRVLYTPSRYFQRLLFTQSRRQYFCVKTEDFDESFQRFSQS